jgi:hypothetical protein
MKTVLAIAILVALFPAVGVGASESKHTDARDDGLFGPIRSVSTRQEKQPIDWRHKDDKIAGPGISCWECEYDIEGNRIKSGQNFDRESHGQAVRVVRDEKGTVAEKIFENSNGEVNHRDVFGPHGIVEQVVYANGKPNSRSTWSYDANGRVTEFHRYDQNDVEVERSIGINGASDHNREEWEYDQNGALKLHFVETYNPKTDVWTFTNLNPDGSVKAAVTTVNSVVSYWQRNAEEGVLGSDFYMDREGKVQKSYSCHPNGACDQINAYFKDETSLQESRVEWHDAAGVLRLSFDYEYELDHFGNWTRRTAWVWSPELGERKLCETDYRTLKYWAN